MVPSTWLETGDVTPVQKPASMTDTSRKRRLAAVLFADMVSYTDLSQRNEALALELVEELRQLVQASGPSYGGRVIKTMGDGFLLTFDSGLDAARCARRTPRASAA